MEKVLIIIPAYNEESNILKTYRDLKNSKVKLDVVVINDASTDQTEQILQKNKINHVTLVHNLGIGGAVQTGYKYALEHQYDIAIQFDGDGQHDARYIESLIQPILNKEASLVIGSRFVADIDTFKSTKFRRMGIKVISTLIKWLTGQKITDPTSGFRAADASVIKMFARDYPIEYPEPSSILTLIKAKKKIVEVPVEMRERTGGVSSIRTWKNVYYMINVCLAILINNLKKGETK